MRLNSWCVAPARRNPVARARRTIVALLLLVLPTPVVAEPVPLRQMVELALKHATTASIAVAEEQRVFANYRELRNSFIPQVTASARVRVRVAEAAGAADVLRERLSKLTGLAESGIQTDPDSLPAPPAASDPDAAAKAADSNPAVQAAVEHARAQYLRARAEHKSWLPSIDFAAQYAVLSKFNNYQEFFQRGSFVRNNATIGAVIRFPFLNAPQKARAEAADAEARRADKQTEAARN